MKKMNKAIALILVLIIGMAILAGCGGEKISGKYDLVSITTDGEKIIWADYIKEMKDMYAEWEAEDEFDEENFVSYLEFKDGGKCTAVLFGGSEEGTYKVDGKNIEVTVDGDTIKGTIDGNKITLEDEGESMVFEKK